MRESLREEVENGGLERGGQLGGVSGRSSIGFGWNVDDGSSKTSEGILGRDEGSKVA
jgi:hypothetical protein